VNKICDSTINQDVFTSDEHPNFFASKKYISLRLLFSRLFGLLRLWLSATSASVERVFSRLYNGRAYATLLRLSVTYVLWLNGAS